MDSGFKWTSRSFALNAGAQVDVCLFGLAVELYRIMVLDLNAPVWIRG